MAEHGWHPYQVTPQEMFPAEVAYIGLFGGSCWEVIGVNAQGGLDTAYGNSEVDAIDRATKADLKPV